MLGVVLLTSISGQLIIVFYYAVVCVDGETGGESADSATVTLDQQQQGGAGDTEQQQQNVDDAESEQAANAASGEQGATGETNAAAAENGECMNQTLAPPRALHTLKAPNGNICLFSVHNGKCEKSWIKWVNFSIKILLRSLYFPR